MKTSAELDGLLERARECLKLRQFAEAIALYRQALTVDNLHVPAHEGLARAAFLANDFDLAIEHFQRIAQIEPRRSQALVNLGAVQNRKEDYAAAVQTLRKALAKDRKCAEAYYNLGLAHRGLNQLSMAVSAYKEAIRLNPQMAEAYQNLANVFVEMGNADQAILHYRRALEIRPDFERAKRGLERAQGAKQEAKNAISPFGRLVDVSQMKKAGEADAGRPLTEKERFDDRTVVHDRAKEAQRAATAVLQLLQNDLEEDLLELNRAVIQSRDVRGFWHEFRQLAESADAFEKIVDILERCTDELRAHEKEIARLTSQPAAE
ncbi:MAG: tetratricopeptide repeat protein [Planctomycetaceae bacterium]|nr:tetratricopeptide repeat protein [Planctomycetaceae bacterium]